MQKLTALIMAVAMSLSLVACGGGPDRQPAIDAMNKASAAYNEVADKMNEKIDIYPQDMVDDLNEMVDIVNEQVDRLNSDEELTQEDLDAIIEVAAQVEAWAAEFSPMVDTFVGTEPVMAAYDAAANAYNEVITYMNENLDAFTQEDIDAVAEVGELLASCKEDLEGITFTDQESLDAMIAAFGEIEVWAVEIKTALGI